MSSQKLYDKNMISGCSVSLDQESFLCRKDRNIVILNVETGNELEIISNVIKQTYTEHVLSMGLVKSGEIYLLKQNQRLDSIFEVFKVFKGDLLKGTVIKKNIFTSSFFLYNFSNFIVSQ